MSIKAHQPTPQPPAKVTLFPNIKTTKDGQELSLDRVMQAIQSGRWRDPVDAVRKGGDKRNLPYFTGSGVFKIRREDGLKQHNRRIIIDIDKHDPDDIKALVGAGPDPYVEYCFTSCGGNGAALIFKINPEKHTESFEAISAYLSKEYGFVCDIAVKDVSRARFVSYDPELLHNPQAETFAVGIGKAPNPLEIATKMVQDAPDGQRHAILLKAAKLLGGYGVDTPTATSALEAAFISRPYDSGYNYKATIRDGLGYGNAQPIDGLEAKVYHVARAKNKEGAKLDDPNTEEFIYELSGELGEDFKAVKEAFEKVYEKHNDEHNNKNKTAIAKAEDFIKARYNLKRNAITKRIEQHDPKEGNWTNANIHSIYRAIQHHGVRFGLDRVRSLMASDFIQEYDPFAEYFEALTDYNPDTEPDYIALLAGHLKVRGSAEFFAEMFRKMLVRSIGCGLGDHENRTVFVLVGEKQNTGKSSFVRFLNPFGNKYYTEAPLRDNKDTEFSFSENFIYNLEELNALSNMEINKLKAIISKTVVKERRAYATDAEEEIRRCNFFGSTNKDDFLTDDQNTRWLCFYVEEINFDYNNKETGTAAVQIEDVWRQAWHHYNDPSFNAQLTREESDQRDLINRSYEVNSVEKDVINRWFTGGSPGVCRFFTISEIIEIMVDKTQNKHKFNNRIISKTLKQLGFESGVKKVNNRSTRGYFANLVDFAQVVDDNAPDHSGGNQDDEMDWLNAKDDPVF